jgi:hypothetical protein
MTTRVGFSTSKSWVSRLIRWFSDSVVSHAWLLYFDIDFGRDMVLESTLEGVRIIPFDVFKRHNVVRDEWVFSPQAELASGLQRAGEQLGEQYDFRGLFGMLLVVIGRWLRKRWRNPLHNPNAMFCSEFVASVLKLSAYPGTDYWDPSSMTPDDLMEFFRRDQVVAKLS